MRCREVRTLIGRAFDGRVSLDREFRIEEHARECERCRKLYEDARQLEDLVLNLPSPPLDRIDVDRAVSKINAGIDARADEAAPTPRRPRVAQIAAAAALLASLSALLWTLPRERRSSSSAPVASTAPVPPAPAPAPVPVPEQPAPSTSSPFDLPALVLDRERLAWARTQVRERIDEYAPETPGTLDRAEAELFANVLDVALSPLRSEAWPVRRIVEGLLDDADPRTADAATRYLGLRGDRVALAALEARLATEGKRVATRALCDADEAGFEALASAVWDPDLTDLVVQRMERVNDHAGVRWVRGALARAARSARRSDSGSTADALAGLLARYGDPGLDALVDLAGHRLFTEDVLLAEISRAEHASEWLVATIAAGPRERDMGLLLNTVRTLHPPELQRWVEELCWSRTWASTAMDALASFDGTPATCDCDGVLATFLDLSFGVGEEDARFRGAWTRVIERGPERLERFAMDRLEASASSEVRRYLELLVVSERAEAVPAILTLAASRQLADEDRERAILAAGELGTAEHLSYVAHLFASLERDQSELAAACLFAAHSMSASEGIDVLLAGLPVRKRDRILALFQSANMRPGSAVLLFKLAREIEPVLSSTEDEPWSNS